MRALTCCFSISILLALGATTVAAEPAPSAKHLKFLQPLVGDWRTVYAMDGKETEGEFHCKWAPGRYCLIWTAQSRSKATGEIVSHGSSIIAWDPIAKRAKELAALSDGTLAEAWFDFKDGKLVIDRTGITPDGVRYTTKPVCTFNGDRMEFPGSKSIDEQGKVIEEISAGYFERIKSEK